jgi:hypothetical protein
LPLPLPADFRPSLLPEPPERPEYAMFWNLKCKDREKGGGKRVESGERSQRAVMI